MINRAAGLVITLLFAPKLLCAQSPTTWSATAYYAVVTGGPFSAIKTVKVAIAEVDVAAHTIHRGSWQFDLPIAAIPLALAFRNPQTAGWFRDGAWWGELGGPRGTAYGVGIKPIGLRIVRRLPWGALFASTGSGLVWFHQPTPGANSRRLNYIGSADFGLRANFRRMLALSAGYRFNHISNAYFGTVNPGIDSHMLSLGVQLFTTSGSTP